MNKRGCLWFVAIAGVIIFFRAVLGCFYAVNQTEQVIVTQFGKPVGEPTTDPGLHLKMPFIQDVNRIDKRFLEWDGLPVAIPTRDKTYIHVDTYARWRIARSQDLLRPACTMNAALSLVWKIFLAVRRGTRSRNTI